MMSSRRVDPYILHEQHSENKRKHLIKIFMGVYNPLKEHSFILVETRKMNDEFQKSAYILLRQHSGNARKHLVNIFVCVSNPVKKLSQTMPYQFPFIDAHGLVTTE